MLIVELTEKDIRVLQLILGAEIKENESKIIKIRETAGLENHCLISTLEDRNKMLQRVKDRLHNTKRYIEEV